MMRQHVGHESALVVAFDVKAPVESELLPRLVAAGSLEVVRGLVYRSWRENLTAGERLAPHVRPPAPS